MKKKKLLLSLFCAAMCLLMTACGEQKIMMGGTEHKDNETELTAVLSADELSVLDSFKALQKADLRGSTCYDEIIAWADAHPSVEVVYSVILPDGRESDPNVESLDLSALTSADVQAITALFPYLPQLKSVELGDVTNRLSAEDISAISAALPECEFSGSASILGKTYGFDNEHFDFSNASHEDAAGIIELLPLFRSVSSIDFGNDSINTLTFDDIAAIEAAAPDAAYSYDFTMYGREFSVNTKKINLSHVYVDDEGETVRAALRCMPFCDYLDMDSTGVSNEAMAVIRDENPQVNVIWRVFFGLMYSCRTDIETIVASDSYDGGELTDENAVPLKYCTKVKRLDIGHNSKLTHLSFISYMPDLEILILCYAPALKDISAIADCPHLEYIELITAENLEDITPLSELHELKHLNMCNMYKIEDISPLYGLTQLERLWIGCNVKVPEEQVAIMQAAAPQCVINTTVWNPTDDHNNCGWRYSRLDGLLGNVYAPRYALLREQFDYANEPFCYTFSRYDPYFFGPAPTPED